MYHLFPFFFNTKKPQKAYTGGKSTDSCVKREGQGGQVGGRGQLKSGKRPNEGRGHSVEMDVHSL